jgi:hypothetical protein
MNLFDSIFFSFFNHSKKRFKKHFNGISVFYITLLQSSVLLLLGIFFSEFFTQMKVNTMSSTKAWALFIITALIIYFKNWMQSSGKKRIILKAKMTKNKSQDYNFWVLCLLPLGCIFLSILLLKVL